MALTNPRFSSTPALVAASENRPPLKVGATGEAVAIVQQALLDLGMNMPISTKKGQHLPDGIFGPETKATVEQFQRLQGLQVDGIVGRHTLQRIEELVAAVSLVEVARFRVEGPRKLSVD